MKIQTNNKVVIAHGKVNLPEVGIVDVPEDGIIEVSDKTADYLTTNMPLEWKYENADDIPEHSKIDTANYDTDQDENVVFTATWMPHTLSDEDIENNPDLCEKYGLKAGDEIGIPAEAWENAQNDGSEEETEDDETDVEEEEETETEEETESEEETSTEDTKSDEDIAAERNDLKKKLLVKTIPQLHDYAAALELPKEEWKDLNKVPLIDYILDNASDNV